MLDPFWKMDKPRIGEVQHADYDLEAEEKLDTLLDSAPSRKRKREERIDNRYATVYSNQLSRDAFEEERFAKKKKMERQLSILRERLEGLLKKHEKVFSREADGVPTTVDRTLAEHHIKLKPQAKLGLSPGMRRRSPLQETFVEEMIETLLKAGLISKCSESVAYASQVHVVNNPGRPMRMTIDYRGLNAVTEADSFPIPRMDELLFSLKGCRFFSTVDAQKGFWHIPVSEDSRALTAFRTRSGVYVWNVMPMGLTNSPASFQRFMSECFHDMNFVRIYIDDIIIFSRTAKEHLEHLEAVLERCAAKGITLKASKCHFLKQKLKILGYYISADGITQDPEKLESIKEFKRPSNVRSLRRFLGMIQFFRMFSSSTARILHPLYELCKKGHRWKWGEKEDLAFRDIKTELLKKRTLVYPDVNERFYVSVDASDFAYGANLYQLRKAEDGTLQLDEVLAFSDDWSEAEKDAFRRDEKVPFIVESFSKKWNKHEVNYSTSEKECLAIVNALERWSHYLTPREFEVWSDHRALTSLTKTDKPRLKRWKLRLTPFNFNLQWKAGRTMKDVDTLSRDDRYQTLFVDGLRGYRIDTEEPVSFLSDSDESSSEIEFYFVEDHPHLNLEEGCEWIFPTEVEEKGKYSDLDEAEAIEERKSREKSRIDHHIDTEIRKALLNSHSNFAQSQKNDARLRLIMEALADPEGEPEPAYSLREDGVLLRDGKIVMPRHELPLLLWLMHDHPMSGHVGGKKLIARIRERFYVSN